MLGSFLRILLILVAEQFTLVAKADIPQAEAPPFNLNKVVPLSRANSHAPRMALGVANADAIKEAATKPWHSIQVVLRQTEEEKENLQLASSYSDNVIKDLLAPREDTVDEQGKQLFNDFVPPNPFLDSDDEYDDLVNRKSRETRGARAEEEPQSDQEIFSFDENFSYYPTHMDLPNVPDEAVLKSCLRVSTAPKKGRRIAWKDKPAQYRFYNRRDSDDSWSQFNLKI